MAGYSDVPSSTSDQAFEIKLIRAVKLYKSLYSADDPNHFNVNKNKERWSKVAAICKRTVTECRSRWHSLMRTYYLSPPNSTWIHIEAFRNLGSNLSDNVVRNPTKNQKDELLKELLLHSSILLSPESTTKTCLNIWMEVVARCNNMPGAILTRPKWQEYWFSLKQNVAENWSNLKLRVQKDGDEIKIINICGVSQLDSLANIASALMRNTELAGDWQNPSAKCKKCLMQRNELLFNGCCQKCRNAEVPLCCKCETGIAVHQYKVNEWSQKAIYLLQFELTSNQISLCFSCANQINKIATINWKSCRICATPQKKYDYLYNKCNQNLREVFKEATNISLSECDGLPGYICEPCKTQIQEFNKFYHHFKQTQIRLKFLHDTHFINDKFIIEKLPQYNGNGNLKTLLPNTNLPNNFSANNPQVTKPSAAPSTIQECSPTTTAEKPIKSSIIVRKHKVNLEDVISPESINFDFSLQPSILRQTKKTSSGVFHIDILQSDDEDQQGAFNNNVTTQKRISATQTTAEAPVSIKKVTPQNGDMHDVIPLPYVPQASGARILTKQLVDKIPQASKEILATTLTQIKQKSDISPKQVTSSKQILLKPQSKVVLTVEQAKLILHQQQEIKKNRKHFDNVNEHQVGLLTTETLAPSPSMSRTHQPNDTKFFNSTEQIKDTTSVQNLTKVLIKEETVDYDPDIFIKTDPMISYPDSFQFKSEHIEADDNFSTFTDIQTEDSSIIPDNSFKEPINTLFPVVRCLRKRKKEDEKKEIKNNNKRKIIQPKLRKIRIMLKRDKKIQMFLSK